MKTPPGGAVWITGADGFVGRWLLRALAERGRAAAVLLQRLVPLPGDPPAAVLELEDLARMEPGAPLPLLDELPPPCGLVHLAAMAWPPDCEAAPDRARAINVAGPARLYEAVLTRWPETPVLHVSSGYVYRPGPEPRREEDVPEPANVYAATKLQGEAVALGLRDRGHRVGVVRPFNHAGPGQSPRFALPSFALRLAALEAQGGGKLDVGPLDAIRDFLHVRTVVDAYLDLLDRLQVFDVVNVCSGTGRRIGELLDLLLARVRVPVEVRRDPARERGDGVNVLVGDPSRLVRVLGRRPALDAEALADELMADARTRVAAGEDLRGA